MDHSEAYYCELARKWSEGSITPEEVQEYLDWYNSEDGRPLPIPANIASTDEEIEQRMLGYIRENMNIQTPVVVRIRKRAKWVAAAAIVIGVAIITGLLLVKTKQQPSFVLSSTIKNDVTAPAVNRATITLASGKIVYLDSSAGGQLATQGNTAIIKNANGQLVYKNAAGQEIAAAAMNTLTNPRGSQVVNITLSDGTRVWLNAGSSLTYPVAFTGEERKVELKGEGYFEVVRNPAQRFIVEANGVNTEDLGTHFNINAYEDEKDIKVTLLEGSVRISHANKNIVLKPGQQASVAGSIMVNDADLGQVMAWRSGKFDFGEGSSLREAMMQAARWYDVQIEYKSGEDLMFWGSVSREQNLSDLLKWFELTGKVHFKIEGKKVIVNP